MSLRVAKLIDTFDTNTIYTTESREFIHEYTRLRTNKKLIECDKINIKDRRDNYVHFTISVGGKITEIAYSGMGLQIIFSEGD